MYGRSEKKTCALRTYRVRCCHHWARVSAASRHARGTRCACGTIPREPRTRARCYCTQNALLLMLQRFPGSFQAHLSLVTVTMRSPPCCLAQCHSCSRATNIPHRRGRRLRLVAPPGGWRPSRSRQLPWKCESSGRCYVDRMFGSGWLPSYRSPYDTDDDTVAHRLL